MSVKINQIEDFTKKCIINDIKLNTLGPCECKISVGGNIEPMYLKLKERIQLLQKKYDVVITKVDVYHDDDLIFSLMLE